jgi:hypothetical protein
LAWSLRSLFDPVLFLFAGSFRRVVPIIVPPGLLVLAATVTDVVFPWTGWVHWLTMPFFFGLSLYLSFRMLPPSARARVDRVLEGVPLTRRLTVGLAPGPAGPDQP